jgi:peptidyl-prolyl cis-trans isomerase SurA
MKKSLLLTLLFFFASFCINTYAKESGELDKIIAVVNDDVVTKSELNRSLSLAKLQGGSAMNGSVLEKKVLDQLINKKLQLQIAKQVGITINDEEIDRFVENIASKNNLSVNDFYQRIHSEGLSSEDYRDQLREQMAIQRLQQQEVGSRLNVTPEEIKNFMQSKLWKNNTATNKEYHVEDILIALSETPSTEEITAAKKQAEVVATQLKQGKNSNEVQKELGDTVSNNDLGWRKLPEIPSAFAEHIANMQAHEVAGPIQASNGFHVLRLVAERSAEPETGQPGQQSALNATQAEQLLLQRKFEEHVQSWVSRMRSQAFITVKTAT